MPDEYQAGSDVEWLKHSNNELAALVKRRARQIAVLKFLLLLALASLGWVAWKFHLKAPLNELWKF